MKGLSMPLTIFLSIFFTLIATAVMSFISLATPIGPWIEAIIALSMVLLNRFVFNFVGKKRTELILPVTAAGIGGIAATACGFSWPTLFFVQKSHFLSLLANPLYFSAVMFLIVLSAGLTGICFAYKMNSVLHDESMPFSIGKMIHTIVAVQEDAQQAFRLFAGAVTSAVYAIVSNILAIPNTIVLWPSLTVSFLTFPRLILRSDIFLVVFAIGFVTGSVLLIPLAVGVFSRIFLVNPLHEFIFPHLSAENFLLAFLSGLVVQGALLSLLDTPSFLKTVYTQLRSAIKHQSFKRGSSPAIVDLLFIVGILLSFFLLMFIGNMSLVTSFYSIFFTLACSYQLIFIAGKVGIAPLGRYATFVMLPGLILLGFDPLQATLVSTFVELCGGVTVDALFGAKAGILGEIHERKVMWYQLLGLLVTAVSIGAVFWFLINHFGLGSIQLLSQKAQGRALLIRAHEMNFVVLVAGVLYATLLQKLKISPFLVLGGLAMPLDFSIILILGGCAARLLPSAEEWESFWSGVFAIGSLSMLIQALL
jgi:hypothetical protein